jgi:hypothetical protein
MSAGQPAMSALVIRGLSTSPLKPTAGVPFELSAQGLNAGRDPIRMGHPLHLSCRVIQGGPNCPVPTGPISLNAVIPAQGLHRLKLGSFTAQPGLYEIVLSSGPEKGKNIKTLTLSVETAPISQKAPAVASPPAPPVSGLSPGGQVQTPSGPSTINRPLKR